jgi:AhpD family alkylhydroperoxidase
MSIKVFQDNVFPRHVSDLMNLMHMVVYKGTDGEEAWDTYLDLRQKEYVSLGLAQYYQCDHCVDYHLENLCRLEKTSKSTISQNINSMILFLRIDTRTIGRSEKQHWIRAWQRFAQRVSAESDDQVLPYLLGLAIGIARDDEFLIDFCGREVNAILTSGGIDVRASVGELESVVIFMKAAASKNRIIDKIERIFDPAGTPV